MTKRRGGHHCALLSAWVVNYEGTTSFRGGGVVAKDFQWEYGPKVWGIIKWKEKKRKSLTLIVLTLHRETSFQDQWAGDCHTKT